MRTWSCGDSNENFRWAHGFVSECKHGRYISDIDLRSLEQAGLGPTANDELISKRPYEVHNLIMKRYRVQEAAAGAQA